jgi:cytochrome b6-f complex iron-sulfur subunit
MNQEDAKAPNAPQTPDSDAEGKPQPPAAGAGTPPVARAPAAQPAGDSGSAAGSPEKPAPATSAPAKPAAADTGGQRPAAAARARAAGARPAAGARAARAARAAAGADVPSTAAISVGGGAAAAAAAGGDVSRRGFLSWISAGWLAFAALTTGTLIGTVRFLFPNVLFEPPQTFRAGLPEEYTVGNVSTRFKDQFAVWIVRTPAEIYVLSTVCTHLGCTPNWLEGEQKFKCPCHGSGFRKTGINFEGPAPRPLERYKVSLADDGQILVDKTRKYQWEKGEWTDPESFLAV